MITYTQWRKFCWDLYDVKRNLGCVWGDISIHGRPVGELDLKDYKIVTYFEGTPKQVYDYKRSLDQETKLKHLYRSVKVKTDMERLYKFNRELKCLV